MESKNNAPDKHQAEPTTARERLRIELAKYFFIQTESDKAKPESEGFYCEMYGNKVWVNTATWNALLEMAEERIAAIEGSVAKIVEAYSEAPLEYSVFLNSPITDHKLSMRTYHGLKGNGCETMLDVAKLGWKGVLRIRMLGEKSVDEIRKLFIREGCVELFDERNSHE